jgi:T5orf172 domain
MAYVAEVGEEERRTKDARPDRRLRVIFDNRTESDLLIRSLQRALYKDESGRRIVDPNPGPLFGGKAAADDNESGTIYVLRSKSDLPLIAEGRDSIHKIGVTGVDLEARIANAEADPTFLFAGVDIVAKYKLYNINRAKLENILHARTWSASRACTRAVAVAAFTTGWISTCAARDAGASWASTAPASPHF